MRDHPSAHFRRRVAPDSGHRSEAALTGTFDPTRTFVADIINL
jgi:hypothetical protein